MIMKKYTIYFSIFVASIFALTGCAGFDDMNKNPYVLYETNAESFVQPMIYNTEKTIVNSNYSVLSSIMQYVVSTNYENSAQLAYNYVISEAYTQNLWTLYTQYGNAQYMLALARKEQNPAMVGVALVMRSLIAHVITDTYGNVPYSKAGLIALQGDKFEYTTPYDRQQDIYTDLLRSLEEANACFAKAEEMVDTGALDDNNFNAMCDFMYGGDVDKWRRFGNSLYLRLLMRVSLKVNEESAGIVSLGEEFGDINIIAKINEIYECYLSGSGNYPVMRGLEDSARVEFKSTDSALYTPFYSTTSGNWKSMAACSTLVDKMIISYSSATEDTDSIWDPRYFRMFTKAKGAPTQIMRDDMRKYFEEQLSSAGNSLIGRYPSGTYTGTHVGDLKMDATYAFMNYDELLFIFAEAGARNWIPMGQKAYKDLYLDANLKSILQWQVGWEKENDYYTATSPAVVNFMDYLDNEFDYSKSLEIIMRQKYVAMFWVGVESWADYRRTGYPILKTNGPAAENRGILPTRLRYPATEAFQNAKWHEEALNDWLGGENNMQTDVWWASTEESKALRRLGRQ